MMCSKLEYAKRTLSESHVIAVQEHEPKTKWDWRQRTTKKKEKSIYERKIQFQ